MERATFNFNFARRNRAIFSKLKSKLLFPLRRPILQNLMYPTSKPYGSKSKTFKRSATPPSLCLWQRGFFFFKIVHFRVLQFKKLTSIKNAEEKFLTFYLFVPMWDKGWGGAGQRTDTLLTDLSTNWSTNGIRWKTTTASDWKSVERDD